MVGARQEQLGRAVLRDEPGRTFSAESNVFTDSEGRQNTVFCEPQQQNGCDLGSEGQLSEAGDKTRQVSKGWIMRSFSIPSTRMVVPGTAPASGRVSGYVCGLSAHDFVSERL